MTTPEDLEVSWVTWVNCYHGDSFFLAGYGRDFFSAAEAQSAPRVSRDFDHVEMRINGQWQRPPVGMQRASHRWVRSMSSGVPFGNGFSFRLGPWKLEQRS